MLTLLLLASVLVDPFAAARADVDRFCQSRPACVAEQSRELGYFITIMAGFREASTANARRCMAEGRRGRFIDWTVATPCMRRAVSGRPLGD